MRPAVNWSLPSVAETDSIELWLNFSGSAPYFRTLARSEESCWVNWPSICALPDVIASLTPGQEYTVPSRTIAKWLRVLLSPSAAACWVKSANVLVAGPLRLRLTVHCSCPFCGSGGSAWALVTCSPEILAGHRMNL